MKCPRQSIIYSANASSLRLEERNFNLPFLLDNRPFTTTNPVGTRLVQVCSILSFNVLPHFLRNTKPDYVPLPEAFRPLRAYLYNFRSPFLVISFPSFPLSAVRNGKSGPCVVATPPPFIVVPHPSPRCETFRYSIQTSRFLSGGLYLNCNFDRGTPRISLE